MARLIDELIAKAKGAPRRVALPEATDADTLRAARTVLDEGIAHPVLVGPADKVRAAAAEAGVDIAGMELVDTSDEEAADALAERYMHAGRERLVSAKGARRKVKKPLYYAMVLEDLGDVDCTFCGHVNTTGDVLMAAQMMIGLAEGVDVPSILALAQVPGFEGPEGDVIALTDCGLNPEPTEEELASIAIAACDNVRSIMGWEPRAAFVSYSTDGSGKSPSIERVRKAVDIARERRADLSMDGEFQLDAAIVPAVAAKKVHRVSDVAGRANVLVLPDLNCANTMIKTIQLFAGGKGYGHTLSGFRRPVADSSRGASVEEMVGDIAMLVLAAAE